MENPLISIIIPTYNVSDLLKLTIKSVLNQSYKNYEIIIIDDGSEDDTEEVVRNFNNEKISYFKLGHTGMPAKVRNKGIEEAKGEYIAFLDSDDLWCPDKLDVQLKVLKENEELLGVASRAKLLPDRLMYHLRRINYGIISFEQLLRKNIIYTSSVIIKKEVIEKVGKFDESHYLRSGQDISYWLDILKFQDKSILILKEPLIIYRVHDKDLTRIRSRESNYFKKRVHKFKYLYLKYESFDKEYMNYLLRKWIKVILLDQRKRLIIEGNLSFKQILKDNLLTPFEKIEVIIYYYLKKIHMQFNL